MKETEDDTDTLCSWTGKIYIVTVTILKLNYIFIAIPMKIPMAFFTGLEQVLLKLNGNTKTLNSQNNLEEKTNLEVICCLNSKYTTKL